MIVDLKNNVIELHLAGTEVQVEKDEKPDQGVIKLTPYGARNLAYELLSKANDDEHYNKHKS